MKLQTINAYRNPFNIWKILFHKTRSLKDLILNQAPLVGEFALE